MESLGMQAETEAAVSAAIDANIKEICTPPKTRSSSVKLSLRFVREKFNVTEHLNSLAILKDNRALYKNMEKTYIEKVVKELHGKFGMKRGNEVVDVEDSRHGEVILFQDGSQAKNPLFHETLTHRIARQMGHV